MKITTDNQECQILGFRAIGGEEAVLQAFPYLNGFDLRQTRAVRSQGKLYDLRQFYPVNDELRALGWDAVQGDVLAKLVSGARRKVILGTVSA